ncbi:MAG: SDR family oxidoreductase [Sinimarinibacterium sp.]|jgi:NAD(P)-dependent dehydrogenase (short-subunit alcohol dehydrogenase family)/pimeloyl-ACP methyl ester carboxylesterase
MSTSTFVQSGNVQLAVRSWGDPTKPTILLVHGYPDSSHVWDATAGRLAEDFHVVAYDVRGAGASSAPHPVEDYDLEHLVNDAAAVIEAAAPHKMVHLVGHDWGSIQAWEMVTTERLKNRIASYTTISGPSLDHAGYWILQRLKSGAPADVAKIANQVLHSWYIGMFHLPMAAPLMWKMGLDKLWPTILEKVEGIDKADVNPTQKSDGRTGVNLYRANVLKRVLKPHERRTDIPVQLVVPLRDHFVSPELFDDLPKWAPRLWRTDVDAGHWLQVSDPDLVAVKIADFVRFVDSGVETPALRRARVRGPRRKHSGKLVVVTGAGSGIGRETLLAFAEAGADTVAVDIDLAAAQRTAELARLLDADSVAYRVDVGDAKAMETLAEQIDATLGAPDVVVNNAGIGMSGPMLDTSTADWEKILRVNLWGVIHGSKLFAQQMLDAGKKGHIVNVSSGLAFLPTRLTPAYNTTKAAVQMLSECLRAELAGQGIGVSAIYPGIVHTNITESARIIGGDDEVAKRRRQANRLYALRNLKPTAVAAAILDAVEHNRAEARVGAEVHAIRWLSRLAPGLARRVAQINV